MVRPSQEKAGRNDSCPCGSGRKYKRCCLKVSSAVEDSPWRRQQDASGRLTREMLDFAHRKFGNVICDAWEDFNQHPFPPPLEEKAAERQIFLPYFLFEWDPERPARSLASKPRPGIVGRHYMEKAGSRLSELEELIFAQATTQPVGFYEVLRSDPGESLVLRNILIGGDTEVVEHSASQVLVAGDIVYAQLWRLPSVVTLGRLAPVPIPPRNKAEVVGLRAKLRKKIARQNRDLAERDLIRYAGLIRTEYLDIRDALLMPPRLCNTDGDLILFHTLIFRIGSARVAFEALASLAWGVSKEELLEAAEVDAQGVLHNVAIEWSKQGNKKFGSWENTILGHLEISGRSLVARVNSKERAAMLCREIEQRLGILAILQDTVTQTPEELTKESELQKASRSTAPQESEPLLDPEVREEVEAKMQQMMAAWIHQQIPALGGRTPIEAIQDQDGREIVESLLVDWERRSNVPAAPGAIRQDVGIIRRLLDLGLEPIASTAGSEQEVMFKKECLRR